MSRIATDPQRVDWWQVFEDLRRAGIPTYLAAKHIQVPHSTLLGWRNIGSEPKFIDGERLVDLWVGVTGRDRSGIPRAGTPWRDQSVLAPQG